MSKYKVVLFDLDHTLWDYHKNAHETLSEIFTEYLGTGSVDLTQHITLFKGTIASVNDRSAEMERKRGQFKDAYEYYKLAVYRDDTNAEAWKGLAKTEYELDHLDASLDAWRINLTAFAMASK